MEKLETVGERIRNLRQRSGLEQRELADRLGYKSDTTISKWEKGINLPTGAKLIKLSNILNTSVDYILHGIDVKNQEPDLEELLDGVMLFGGKPLSDTDKSAIRGIISGYMNSKGE